MNCAECGQPTLHGRLTRDRYVLLDCQAGSHSVGFRIVSQTRQRDPVVEVSSGFVYPLHWGVCAAVTGKPWRVPPTGYVGSTGLAHVQTPLGRQTRRDRVLGVLADEDGPLSAKEVGARIGARAEGVLQLLRREGRVRRVGCREWTLA